MILYLFVIGFISILGQVSLLRELNVAFFGIELIYILSFGVWLLGTSIGAIIGRKEFVPSNFQINILFICSSLLFLADIGFIRLIRIIFGSVSMAFLPFSEQLIVLFIALLPVSICLGILLSVFLPGVW